MKEITIEEAVKDLRELVQEYKDASFKGLNMHVDVSFNEERCKNLETILDKLKKYDVGEIISIKVQEKYYLVSKNKEKQMIYANKELFEEYIPKDKIREIFNNKIMKEKQNIIQLHQHKEDTNDSFIINAISSKIYELIKLEKELLREE